MRFFVDLPLGSGAELDLPEDSARHAQVRRVQPGDALTLFDGRGGEWSAQVLAMTRRGVRVRLLAHHAVERELPLAVTLAVGMPANERMDWLVEKATELGAAVLQPLHCERAVLRLDGERATRKVAHWQAVAAAAAGQCGRTRVPQVAPVRSLAEWLALPAPAGAARRLLSLAPGAAPWPALPLGDARVLQLLSGPEGGLAPDEQQAALDAGFVPVSLGARVLRAETAPLAVLAALALQV